MTRVRDVANTPINRALESHHNKKFVRPSQPNIIEMEQCVEDLIDYFQESGNEQDGEESGDEKLSTDDHEIRQHRAQELLNRFLC